MSTPKFRRAMTQLTDLDRSWLVAALTSAGMKAREIEERMSCSLRLVRTIRSNDLTKVCRYAQEREGELLGELHRMELEYRLARGGMDAHAAEVQRLRTQLDQIIEAHRNGTLAVFPKCGHPKVRYNVYRRGGREYCRSCRRTWDQTRRTRRKRGVTCVSVTA